MFAIGVTWFMTGLNYLGIKKAGDFQLVFTILKGVLILIVAALCFASASGSWTNFSTSLPHAVGGFGGFMLALIATLWAYDGWNDLTMVAGEVRSPERSLPIALIGGLFIVGVLFMATNAAIQYILPAAQIAGKRTACGGGAVDCSRTERGGIRSRCDGPQHLRHAERNGDVGRAYAFCRCARPPLFPTIRAHPSALSISVDFARCAGTCCRQFCCSSLASFSSTSSWLFLPNGFSTC